MTVGSPSPGQADALKLPPATTSSALDAWFQRECLVRPDRR